MVGGNDVNEEHLSQSSRSSSRGLIPLSPEYREGFRPRFCLMLNRVESVTYSLKMNGYQYFFFFNFCNILFFCGTFHGEIYAPFGDLLQVRGITYLTVSQVLVMKSTGNVLFFCFGC